MEIRKKIENIQALRGIAVLLVIFYHAMLHEKKYGIYELLLPDFLQLGAAGVDLFFVISGFVITTVTQGQFRKNGAVKIFIWNRITRIYPLFWFYWILFVLAFYFFSQNMATTSLGGPLVIIRSFMLLPQDQFPILSVSWTLVHELYFYLIFTLFILFERKHLARLLLIFSFILAAGNLINVFSPFVNTAWLKLMFHPLTFEFIAGCLISELIYNMGVRGHALKSLVIGGVSLVVLSVVYLKPSSWGVPDEWSRVLLFGIPCIGIVYGAIALEIQEGKKISKILNVIGDASYSIYLSHAMVFSVTGIVLRELITIKTNAILVFLMLLGAIVWGFMSYFFIERPVLSALRKAKAYFIKQS